MFFAQNGFNADQTVNAQTEGFGPAVVTPACVTCYLTYDMLGSVRMVTNESQSLVARHDYIPFGEEIPDGTAGRSGSFASTSNVTQGFTGQEADGGLASLDYFNARHLAGVLGAFVQADPGNAGADITSPQSWNAYGYVLGNPLGFVDPSGLYLEANPKDPDGGDTGDYCEFDCGPVDIFSPGDGGGGGGGGGEPAGPVIKIVPPAKNLTGPIKVLDCAGYTVARSVLLQTKTQGIEFGGFIYKNNQSSSYFYSTPFSGTPGVLPSFDVHRTQDTPGGFSLAGWYHSHPLVPNYPHPELFSGADLGATRRVGGPGYLLTPNGDILKLLPYPPNAPGAPTRVSRNACQGG